ncbi:hypothetical protein CCMSSC00406_0004618 [Pleurotus cornucopiae]|uniref:Uncharacterized protein n=1 Tax=Pleurotus cornucopiae TaxID=5321 RepID=A0ACB7IWU9_PLECO|nr:hypothetical protein CCMSSC00406_0004618 [Pleurotus cornucopiae]
MMSKLFTCFFVFSALVLAINAIQLDGATNDLERRKSTAETIVDLIDDIKKAKKNSGSDDDDDIFSNLFDDDDDVPQGFFTTVTNVGGSTATIVTRSGGPAITLAAQGKTTTFGGSTWTVPTATPTSTSSGSTSAKSTTTLSGFTTIYTSLDKHAATIVSNVGGAAITLTSSKGTTTTFGGSTYTIATHVLAASASKSNAAGASIQPVSVTRAALGGVLTVVASIAVGAMIVL